MAPFAATTSQHFYGQTLKWEERPNDDPPTSQFQDYLDKSGAFQPIIYVSKNTHATYFRAASFIAHLGTANTQSQYSMPQVTVIATDRADGLGVSYTPTNTDLVALKQPAVVNSWRGLWGEKRNPDFTVIPPNVPASGPPSPAFRGPVEQGGVSIEGGAIGGPKEFHNAYLKITQDAYRIQ